MRSLILFLALFSFPLFAADEMESLDIPESEASYDEPVADVPVENNNPDLPPRTLLKKREASPKSKLGSNEPPIISNIVVLQGLNKVIGRVSTFEIPLGTLASFENLEIIARKCIKSPLDEQPENAALLEILEMKAGEQPKELFFGWMLSSSPGLSGLEHPVYDITVLSCGYKKDLEAN